MNLNLEVMLNKVIDDVGRTVAYAGAKTDDYNRLSTTEADSQLLLRFASQAANAVSNSLRRQILSENLTADRYQLSLEVSNSFDTSLTATLQGNLEAYITMYVAGRWLALSQRDDANDYQAVANELLEQLLRCANSKRRPTRPMY